MTLLASIALYVAMGVYTMFATLGWFTWTTTRNEPRDAPDTSDPGIAWFVSLVAGATWPIWVVGYILRRTPLYDLRYGIKPRHVRRYHARREAQKREQEALAPLNVENGERDG